MCGWGVFSQERDPASPLSSTVSGKDEDYTKTIRRLHEDYTKIILRLRLRLRLNLRASIKSDRR